MTRDSNGNNINDVEVPVGGSISIIDYSEANKITREMIAQTVAKATIPEAYADGILGLITEDGGFQDERDGDEGIGFFQEGYTLPSASKLTTTFTVAENNALIRKLTLGEPDENGVYAVDDIIQPGKHLAYRETPLKFGRILRRAGVVQITGNEPAQQEKGAVTGRSFTIEWIADPLYEGHKYYESIYDPTITPATPPKTVKPAKKEDNS